MEQVAERGYVAQTVMPPMDDRFFVYMFGRGVPPPSNTFRWCTPQLKVEPMESALKDLRDKYGQKFLMLTGVRIGESAAGLRKFGGKNAQPFLIKLYGTNTVASVDEPLPTVTAGGNHLGLIQPFVLGQQSCAAARSVDSPLPTIATDGAIALIEPFIVPYHSGAGREDERAHSLNEPLRTQDTSNRYALVEPREQAGGRVDILLRMLQPHELSAAMSFPSGYKFYGTREHQVKQIGNAVPVELARAHCMELLREHAN